MPFNRIRTQYQILIVSFLALFMQMVLIRYLALELLEFMYFKNFVLMASFLGLGLGLGVTRSKHDLMAWFVPITGAVLLLALFGTDLKLNNVFLPSTDNSFQWQMPKTTVSWIVLTGFYLSQLALVGAIVSVFLPLGQRLGRLFTELPPQSAYAWDLTGSILGVVAYTAVSFLGVSPKVAALAALGAGGALLVRNPRSLAVSGVTLLILVAVFSTIHTRPAPSNLADPGVPTPTSDYYWSPYYRVNWENHPVSGTPERPLWVGYRGFVNGFYYFDMLDLRLAGEKTAIISHGLHVPLPVAALHYSVPYAMRPGSSKVLILGGGPGNDAAAALLNGAQDVTVVEIDPVVAWMGHKIHPLRPYDDARVKVVINDARAFVANDQNQYDIVSFGHLDSYTLVSSFSDVRLDSYVYTLESFQKAWSLVKPGGLLSVSFASVPFVTDKMYKLLWTATGQQPLALRDTYLYTTTFVIPKGQRDSDAASWKHLTDWIGGGEVPVPSMAETSNPIPTDDWPFLFLREKRVSVYYTVAVLLLLLLATGLVRFTFGVRTGLFKLPTAGAQGTAETRTIDWHLFWLGGGFLLVETRSMTELGLLFGSTWMVNAIAVVGVLFMNLVAIAYLRWRPSTSVKGLYLFLFLSIALNLAIPTETFLVLPVALRLLMATLLIYSPLFFAGMIFTQSFSHSADSPLAFGSNLLGAIVGGCLESVSTMSGFRMLWYLALGLYLMSLVVLRAPAPASTLEPT